MPDLRQYWQEIRALEAGLSEYLWLVDAAGVLVEVSRAIAAKLLHAKSHRVATEDEVSAHRARWAGRSKETARAEMRRRGIDTVSVE
jgi:hypothetical protein